MYPAAVLMFLPEKNITFSFFIIVRRLMDYYKCPREHG
jgi:hypothetical protein